MAKDKVELVVYQADDATYVIRPKSAYVENYKEEILGQGFLPFLFWVEDINNRVINSGLEKGQLQQYTKQQLFDKYFNLQENNYEPELVHGLFQKGISKEEYITYHINRETDYFNQIDSNSQITETIGVDKYNFYSQLFKDYIAFVQSKSSNPGMIGFDCPLSKKIIDEVYWLMVDGVFIEADIKDFRMVFSNKVENNREPIVWLIKRGYNGHKSALRDFLELMLPNVNLDTNINKKKIAHFFTDGKNKMSINKKKAPSNYITTLEEILSDAKEKADQKINK